MKVAVLIKQTPDTAELPKVTVEEARSGEVSATMVLNPWDEFAVEEAIDLADRFNCESTAISLGREGETEALKHALAMGVDSGLLVDERVIGDGDEWATAEALAEATRVAGGEEGTSLVLAGKMSVDGNSGVIYAGVACKLGWDLLVNVTRIVDIVDGKLIAEQVFEGGQETVEIPLPVVVSVAKEINEPRYPASWVSARPAGPRFRFWAETSCRSAHRTQCAGKDWASRSRNALRSASSREVRSKRRPRNWPML